MSAPISATQPHYGALASVPSDWCTDHASATTSRRGRQPSIRSTDCLPARWRPTQQGSMAYQMRIARFHDKDHPFVLIVRGAFEVGPTQLFEDWMAVSVDRQYRKTLNPLATGRLPGLPQSRDAQGVTFRSRNKRRYMLAAPPVGLINAGMMQWRAWAQKPLKLARDATVSLRALLMRRPYFSSFAKPGKKPKRTRTISRYGTASSPESCSGGCCTMGAHWVG
jgi:hypothetical protein